MYICKIFLLLFILSQTLLSQTLKNVSLQLQWKHQFEFAGFYIAKEKGFYENVGLDVQIKEFDFGINIVNEVVSQKATFGTNYSSLIHDKSKGKDIVLLSAILQSSPHALITLEKSGIKSLKDFIDKKLMIDKGASSVAPFLSMLQANKVSFDDIKKVPHTFNIDDLINQKVDISTVFVSNEPYYLDTKNIKYKIWNPKDYGFDFYDVLLFTSKDLAVNDPKTVTNFRDASLKGWEYAFSNIEETVELILKKYNSQNKSKDALVFEANELKKLAYYKNRDLGQIDVYSIQRIYDIYNILGLTQKTIDYEEFIFKSMNDVKSLGLTQNEIEFIKKHPIIKVGGETDWPPFDFVQNGKYTGIAKEYLDLISKYTGLKFDIKTGYTWDELLSMGKNKELDLLPVIYYTENREKYFNYTKDYLTVRNYLFSLKSNPNRFNSLDDLNGKTIAFPKGFAQIEILKRDYPKINILETKNALDSIDALITKKADAMIENIALVSYVLKENSIQSLKSDFSLDIGANDLFMASRKDWPILKDILQKGLDKITLQERIQINKKWLEIDDNEEKLYLNRESINYLKNNKFNVYLNNWKPISIYDETTKEFSGLSLDYWNKIKKLLNINDNLVASKGFVDSIKSFKNDKNAVMISLSYTKDRAEFGEFSKPYISFPIGIATNDKENFIINLRELEGKKVAVGKNYSAHKLLQKYYPEIKFVPVKNTLEALDLLSKKEVYAAADMLLNLRYYLQEYSYSNLKVAGTSDFKVDLQIMVNKENKKLIPLINKAINSISDIEKVQFQNKWIQIIKRIEKVDYTLVYIILLISLFLVLFLLWRHKELSKYKNALEEKTKQLNDYVNISTDFVWELDIEGRYTKVSQRVKDILGYSSHELIGKTPFELMPKDESKRVAVIFKEIIAEKSPIVDLENQNIHKNGSLVTLLTNGVAIFEDGEFKGYRGTDKNITQEKEKDILILQQSKMVAVGEMIGNISHQWRQPLSIISTSSTGIILQKELGVIDDEKLIEACKIINENAQYLSKTIDTFRNFMDKEKSVLELEIKNEIVQALNIVKSSLENNYIEFIDNIDYSKQILIKATPNELAQVIINIINNSKDAILKQESTNPFIKLDLEVKIDKAIITIEDNAGGIPENVMPRIFEPYFTTKHKSQGTGLGLHMSYKIITESFSGDIYAKNTKDGVKFSIELPIKN